MIENAIQIICVYAIPLIFAITLHEAAHGWAAKKLGDDTAWILGRVTANPVPHIDPVGTVLVPGALVLMSALTGGAGFVFGWAKPVPVDPRYFKKPKQGMAITALAGPVSNFLLALVLLVAAPHLWHRAEQLLYPRKYEQLVDQWAQTYNLDPLLVDAFIRTESGFDPVATSSVDARGLMQMTEETFLWLRSKIAADEDLAFADLYDPDTSIRFGCYYLHLCLERYNGDVATAAAAYHSGWGTVDNLLRMEEHSADGQTLQGFPYSQMNHYVNKITSCYGAYQRIYAGN